MGATLLCELGLFLLCTLLCTGHTQDAVLTIEPNWSSFFIGEFVTFKCDMNEGNDTDWYYTFNKDGQGFILYSDYKEHVLSFTSTGDSGKYQCTGHRMGSSYTKNSNTVSVTVSAYKPRATLTAGTTIIPVGGSVTLTCSVQSSDGWKYEWFRRTQTTSEVHIRDQQNRDIRVSQGGIYSCRGTRGNPVYYTYDSYDVTIEITFSNKVVVKQQPNWPQIFRGETITLTCEVQEGGETTEWEYEWRGPSTPTQWTHNNDVTFRVSESSSGDYMCKSRRRDDSYSSTEWSEAFTLSGSTSKPRATLTAQSSVIPAGGSVTLSCSVEGSAGWKFDWFRRDSVSSKAQLMRGNEANRVISVSQGGLYHCRGGRGDPVYYTEDSSDVTVVETFPSKPTVTLQPSWTQIYSGETVTVRCEIQGGEGAQWTYEWRAAKLNTPPTSNEYRITVTESDSGGYSCRGRRDYFFSEWSDIITLTVSYKPKAKLRADNTAVPVGGSVTLTCSVNSSSSSSSSSSGWKYYWYRDDTPVDAVSPSNGQISVSQEGLYRCRGGRGNPVYYTEDSQEVHINTTVTVSGADSSSSPVWLIVGLVCGVSLIIILLLLLYRCRQSKCSCFTRWIQSESHSPGSSTNHGVNQNETHEYNSLHPGDANLYESITQEEDTGTGADEPRDLTYSVITLQNVGKKRKHHKPEQSAVYSEVKTGAAEDSLMYAEVKQPKKEKAKKNKGKSSPAADAAVYSEVTSGSSLSQ
ncbi:Fc receptor-like protein 5 [Oreochromis aureus]|uniref:Fc receptor-like protein 5 n=1 Tax=Oreochromis aureus TaxID=47969 RepID=UPI001954E19D|nr:Fc receptor-like protein 5 [Oreochromis aureus]